MDWLLSMPANVWGWWTRLAQGRAAFSADCFFGQRVRRAHRSACHQHHVVRRRGASSPPLGGDDRQTRGASPFPSSVMANAFRFPAVHIAADRRARGPATSAIAGDRTW